MKGEYNMSDLGYEQLRALQIMRDTPDLEASIIASKADCSWDELFNLFKMKLMTDGLGRIHDKQVHPELTILGNMTLLDAEIQKII